MGHLTLAQRYDIESYLQDDISTSEIALLMGRNKSVISREISRNRDGKSGKYQAHLAQRKTESRHKKKHKKVRFTAEIKAHIDKHLGLKYSPEQIVGESKLKELPCVSVGAHLLVCLA